LIICHNYSPRCILDSLYAAAKHEKGGANYAPPLLAPFRYAAPMARQRDSESPGLVQTCYSLPFRPGS